MVGLTGGQLGAQHLQRKDATVHYYGVEEGLPNRNVHSAAYDRNGLLFAATDNGLCFLDGHEINLLTDRPLRFRGNLQRNETGHLICPLYDHPDSLEIIDPVNRTAWGLRLLGTRAGAFYGAYHAPDRPFYYLAGRELRSYSVYGGERLVFALAVSPPAGTRLLYADEFGCVLHRVGDHRVEYVLRGGRRQQWPLPVTDSLTLLHYDECSGYLRVAGKTGFYEIDHRTDRVTRLPDLPSGLPVNRLWSDESDNLLYGNLDVDLLRFKDLVLELNGTPQPAKWLVDIDDRILDVDGRNFREQITLSTNGGLRTVHFSNQQAGFFRRYLYDPDVPPGSFGNVMRGFAEDDEGNVYANKDSVLPYWFRVDPETGELDSLRMRDADGNPTEHWGCGTNLLNYEGYIYGHTCERRPAKARQGFLYRYDPRTDRWANWKLPVINQIVRWIQPSRTPGVLLVFTQFRHDDGLGKIYRFDTTTGSFTEVTLRGEVQGFHGYTRKVIWDAGRQLYWICNHKGLYRYDPAASNLRRYLFPDKEFTIISDAMVQPDGQLLLGTFLEGLYTFDPQTERFGRQVGRHLTETDPAPSDSNLLRLPSNEVANFLQLPGGEFIITTFKGLVYHDSLRTTTFTVDHGLPDNEFNNASLFYAEQSDMVYGGGINGFTAFRASDLVDPRSPYPATLLTYRILNEDKGYEETFALPAGRDTQLVLSPSVVYCGLEFTIPDFSEPGRQRYQTRLSNYDVDWTPLGKDNNVRYTRLPPGTYNFEMRALDASRRASPNVASLRIIVLTPWHQLWYVRLLFFVLVLALAWWIATARINHVRNKLEAERRVQSLELRSLRQQLNPHFIANALNAIRDYIKKGADLLDDEADSAASYITDFSRLMRQFLESSRSRMTPLDQEIAMLQRYVRLEQLRFPGKFTAEFTVDPDLDPMMDQVPSFLLQPLVENAIKHGLSGLAGGGHLRVDFSLDPEDEEILVCTVADNGVGRRNAAKNQQSPDHVSRATTIIEERRAMLASTEDVDLTVTVTDQYTDRPEQPGTVVEVRINAL